MLTWGTTHALNRTGLAFMMTIRLFPAAKNHLPHHILLFNRLPGWVRSHVRREFSEVFTYFAQKFVSMLSIR